MAIGAASAHLANNAVNLSKLVNMGVGQMGLQNLGPLAAQVLNKELLNSVRNAAQIAAPYYGAKAGLMAHNTRNAIRNRINRYRSPGERSGQQTSSAATPAARQVQSEREQGRKHAGLVEHHRDDKHGFGSVEGVEDTQKLAEPEHRMADARFAEPGRDRFAAPSSAAQLAAAGVGAAGAASSVELDKTRSRVLRQERMATRKEQIMGTQFFSSRRGREAISAVARDGMGAFSKASEAVRRLKQIKKVAKNSKNILSLVGVATALTIWGIIWSIIQWNVQLIFTAFGLPGKDFVGLPGNDPFVRGFFGAAIIAIDLIIGIVLLLLLFVVYLIFNPLEAFTLVAKIFTCNFLPSFISGLFTDTC